MNYLIYPLSTLLLTYSVNGASTTSPTERTMKVYNILQTHMIKCPEKDAKFRFYTCPSHLWPEIMHNFIPTVKSLGEWIRRRFRDDAFWFYLAKGLGVDIVRYDRRTLERVLDEAYTWILLNRYLKFDLSISYRVYKCLTATLDSLTDMDLGQVSKLPYNGDDDLFEEINEFVNDPKKARLLDGLKRASRDDREMDHMLQTLRRWLSRHPAERRKAAIFGAALDPDLQNISLKQLRTESVIAPNFEGDRKLLKVFIWIFKFDHYYERLGTTDGPDLKNLLPSFPNRDYLIDFLTRLRIEAKAYGGCVSSIASALKDFRGSVDWDKVFSYNDCAMTGFSMLPDEFYDEFLKLDVRELLVLHPMLRKSDLPFIALF